MVPKYLYSRGRSSVCGSWVQLPLSTRLSYWVHPIVHHFTITHEGFNHNSDCHSPWRQIQIGGNEL